MNGLSWPGVEDIGGRDHLFDALGRVVDVPEDVVREAAADRPAIGHGVAANEHVLAVDRYRNADVALGVARRVHDRYSLGDPVAVGYRLHPEPGQHVGEVGRDVVVAAAWVAGVVDLLRLNEHPRVGEEVGVGAVVPVHVGEHDQV